MRYFESLTHTMVKRGRIWNIAFSTLLSNKMGVCCHFVEQITSFLSGTLQFEKAMSSRGNTLLHFRKQNLYLKIKTTSNKTLREVPPIWHTNQTFSRLASSPGNLILWNSCGISEKVFMACIYSLKGLQGAKDIRVIQWGCWMESQNNCSFRPALSITWAPFTM